MGIKPYFLEFLEGTVLIIAEMIKAITETIARILK